MSLGVSAGCGCRVGAIGRRLADVQRIACLEANASPFAAGFRVNDLHFYVEVVGLYHVGKGDLVVTAPFLTSAVEDINTIRADGNDLPRSNRGTSLRPRETAHCEVDIG